jgi:hypothetical protein
MSSSIQEIEVGGDVKCIASKVRLGVPIPELKCGRKRKVPSMWCEKHQTALQRGEGQDPEDKESKESKKGEPKESKKGEPEESKKITLKKEPKEEPAEKGEPKEYKKGEPKESKKGEPKEYKKITKNEPTEKKEPEVSELKSAKSEPTQKEPKSKDNEPNVLDLRLANIENQLAKILQQQALILNRLQSDHDQLVFEEHQRQVRFQQETARAGRTASARARAVA